MRFWFARLAEDGSPHPFSPTAVGATLTLPSRPSRNSSSALSAVGLLPLFPVRGIFANPPRFAVHARSAPLRSLLPADAVEDRDGAPGCDAVVDLAPVAAGADDSGDAQLV